MNGKAGRPQKDLFGLRYGYLLPIKSDRVDGKTVWFCACTGGGERGHGKEEACISQAGRNQLIPVLHTYLSSGNKRSCGCLTTRSPRERPYGRRAELLDYQHARVDLLDYGRRLIVPEAEPAPQGVVLGGYTIADQNGIEWIVAVEDVDVLDRLAFDTPEYWQATNEIIDKGGRVRATN